MQIFGYHLFKLMIHIIKNLLQIKFIRFLMVGSFNTLLSFLIFSFLYYLGFHFVLATSMNLILGILISFNTHKHITFSSDSKKFYIYICFALMFYFITNILLYYADHFKFNMYISYLCILLPIAMINFVILRRYIFN